jgi:dienelactone hydrolase
VVHTVEQSVTCGVLLYPYLLDIGDATDVADAATQWGFVNAAAGVLVHTIPADVPLLVVRAGRDQFAGVNTAIDRFVAGALATNLSLTIINYADAPHAFDVSDDRASTGDVIAFVLTFLRNTLSPVST